MKFQPGQSGNPCGRKKGAYGGRIQALVVLDRMLAKARNKTLLAKTLEKEFRDRPMNFFKTVVMPLAPKDAKLDMNRDGIVEWKSLLGDGPGERARFDAAGLPIPGRK